MNVKPTGYLEFDIVEISKSLGISKEDTQLYFTDGRRISFLIERRAIEKIPNSQLAPSEGAGYDLIDSKGGHWEVRSLTRGGIYFCPSYMVGSGRSFDENGFFEKLNDVEGYFITDITQFPKMPYWILKENIIRNWWNLNNLGATTKISKAKFLDLIEEQKE